MTSNIFALLGHPVPFFVENFFTEAAAVPLQYVMPPLAAYNIAIVSSFFIGAVTAYALASEFVENRIARFAAGLIYAFSTYHFFRAAGHLGETTMEWMPFFVWRQLVFFRNPTWQNALWSALGLALVPLSEIYYGAYFVIPYTIAMLAYQLIVRRGRFERRTIALLAGSYAVGAVLAAIPLRSFFHLDSATKAATAAYADSSIVPLSADLAAFFLPNPYNPVLGKLFAGAYAAMAATYPIEEAVYLGAIALVLSAVAVVAAARRSAPRIVWFWLGFSIFGILLAVGPVVHVAGRPWIYLPLYKAVFGFSALTNFRAPNRLVVVPLLGTAMLAAVGLEQILTFAFARTRSYVPGRAFAAVVLAASLAETCIFSFPYPAAAVTVQPIYSQIGLDPADTILLDLPLLTSGYYQMLQIYHHKRLVDGYTSRDTPEMAASVQSVPFVPYFVPSFDSGINLAGPRELDDVPKVDFKGALVARNIHYVVFHKIVDPDSQKWALAFLNKNLGTPMDDEPALAVWHF